VVGKEVFRPGRLLCPRAEEAVRNVFDHVIRMETAPKPDETGGHLVLIPRYGDMEATTTATTLGKRRVALLVEWSAFDPGGKLLWVQTVEGYARASTGLNHQKIVEMVVQDLLDKSTDAIKTSREIRPFVENSAAK